MCVLYVKMYCNDGVCTIVTECVCMAGGPRSAPVSLRRMRRATQAVGARDDYFPTLTRGAVRKPRLHF